MTKAASVPQPLLEALLNYQRQQVYPMHTPGHKGGRGLLAALRQQLAAAASLDVSLMQELDDLHAPAACIKEAQALAAELYGSDACFWAVNGTTQAIHAMLLTALKPGEKLLLPRNAHRSVVGGLILGDIEAVYLEPQAQKTFGITTQISAASVAEALAADRAIKAVLITSPNYYGIAADVKAIAAVCHQQQLPLLVDEAHGAHLGFHPELPPAALACGADAVAQSTHKLLGALTQCSMLHVRKPLLDLERAAAAISLLTTTSPNYLLMASLDAARAQLAAHGRALSKAALKAAAKLRRLLGEFPGLQVLSAADCGEFALDPTKVTVNFANWGFSGVEAAAALRKHAVAVELADAANVLFLLSYADKGPAFKAALKRTAAALAEMQHKQRPFQALPAAAPLLPRHTSLLTPRQAFYRQKMSQPLSKALGRISGEQISFYPPGIPVLLPGERISAEIIAYCQKMLALGLPVSGPIDSSLATIRVLEE